MERGGGRESVAVDAIAATDTVSQRRVAMEVAGLAVWCAALRRTKLTDEQVPLSLSAPASALPLEQGSIGPDDPIGPTAPLTSCYPSWGHLHSSTFGRQGSAAWAAGRILWQTRKSDLTRGDAVPFRNGWNRWNGYAVSSSGQSNPTSTYSHEMSSSVIGASPWDAFASLMRETIAAVWALIIRSASSGKS